METKLLLAALFVVVTATAVTSEHCFPGMDCFPRPQLLLDLRDSLDGSLLFPSDELYANLTVMIDTIYTRFPAFIALVKSPADVQRCVKFAEDYNLKLAIQSSGHDYIGRSTCWGCLMINLKNMTDIHVNLSSARHPDGEITVESGNNWLRVYQEVDKYDRVIVGGSAHTVAMGGYTQGGGHSPFSRLHGLAVDNLLEVEVVVADGRIVIANNMTNTDLFWALRGGGGGTFGVVTKFTFKLHQAPKSVVNAVCPIALYQKGALLPTSVELWQKWEDLLATSLAREWGGYTIYSGAPVPYTDFTGLISLYLNHMGEYGSPSFQTFQPFIDFYKNLTDYPICTFTNHSTFLDYEVNAKDALYTESYVVNVLTQKSDQTQNYFSTMIQSIMTPPDSSSGIGCTGTALGGKVTEVGDDETPLNPGFRSAVLSLTCGVVFGDTKFDLHYNSSVAFAKKLFQFGKGSYLNEASEYLPDWKTAYWGNHYPRLLQIKHAWDPKNVFTCHHCVGSDEMAVPGPTFIG